jgi:hypothetical protein
VKVPYGQYRPRKRQHMPVRTSWRQHPPGHVPVKVHDNRRIHESPDEAPVEPISASWKNVTDHDAGSSPLFPNQRRLWTPTRTTMLQAARACWAIYKRFAPLLKIPKGRPERAAVERADAVEKLLWELIERFSSITWLFSAASAANVAIQINNDVLVHLGLMFVDDSLSSAEKKCLTGVLAEFKTWTDSSVGWLAPRGELNRAGALVFEVRKRIHRDLLGDKSHYVAPEATFVRLSWFKCVSLTEPLFRRVFSMMFSHNHHSLSTSSALPQYSSRCSMSSNLKVARSSLGSAGVRWS